MTTQSQFDIPEMYPRPKEIRETGGISELSTDIRLVTSNVFPLQRKAIRSILTASGVKVVANKKRYVVDAEVVAPETFNFEGIPEGGRLECYQIVISGSEVHISSPYQDGGVMAAQTLASIFRAFSRGREIPNCVIRDWPSCRVRGIMFNNARGIGRMSLLDFNEIVDAVTVGKCNLLGVPFYTCDGASFSEGADVPDEFQMIPISGADDLMKSHHLSWYSAVGDMWLSDTYQPVFSIPDLFTNILGYIRENGLAVMPLFQCLTGNTFFPKVRPALSAKDSRGNATGHGFCLSSSAVREFLEKLFTDMITTYFPTGLDYLHIGLRKDAGRESVLCACPECSKNKNAVLDYVCWLVKMLSSHGVKHVVFAPDYFLKKDGKFQAEALKRFQGEEYRDSIVLDWSGRENVSPVPLTSWSGEIVCGDSISTFEKALPKRLVVPEWSSGSVYSLAGEPVHFDVMSLLGSAFWENGPADPKGSDTAADYKRCVNAHFESDSKSYLEIVESLKAIYSDGVFKTCLPGTYAAERGKVAYPAVALEALEKVGTETVCARLAEFLTKAATIDEALQGLMARSGLTEKERDALKQLYGETARVVYVSKAFKWLLELRHSFTGNLVKKSSAPACEALQKELRSTLILIENNVPSFMAAMVLMDLGPIVGAFERLYEQLTALAGKKKASSISFA